MDSTPESLAKKLGLAICWLQVASGKAFGTKRCQSIAEEWQRNQRQPGVVSENQNTGERRRIQYENCT